MLETEQLGRYVLAIDLGTGGPKVGLVDQRGQVICSAGAPVQTLFLSSGGVEHDPAEWWSTIMACAKKVIREAAVPSSAILAIAVTSMWSVTLPVDRDGEPLMNALSWMDERGGPYNRALVKGFPNVQGYQLGTLLKYVNKVGFPPTLKGADALGHMLFIKYEHPEIYRRTYKFLEPLDYINLKLTGKFAATQNSAMPFMMVDNRRLNVQEYDPWLLNKSGIDRDKLPDLLPIDGILGTLTSSVAADLGLSPKTVVICGINDNSSSAIGAGSIADSEPAAVMGNSGYLAAHVPFKKTDLISTLATMPSGLPGLYLFIGELANNSRVLDSYLKQLIYARNIQETEPIPGEMYERASREAASIPAGSNGVIFLPWFNGILSPGEDQYMRGGFLNLSHKTDQGHLTRAVFEGLAMNWRWLRGPSEKLIGRSFQNWRLTGGGALSDVWCQIMADVVGLPMHRQVDPRNNNVIGIALLAFQRLGWIGPEEIPRLIKFDRVFEPDPKTHEIYDRMFKQFMAARKRIRPVFHALNKGINL